MRIVERSNVRYIWCGMCLSGAGADSRHDYYGAQRASASPDALAHDSLFRHACVAQGISDSGLGLQYYEYRNFGIGVLVP